MNCVDGERREESGQCVDGERVREEFNQRRVRYCPCLPVITVMFSILCSARKERKEECLYICQPKLTKCDF